LIKIKLNSPNELSADQFKAIQGSDIHAAMVCHRFEVTLDRFEKPMFFGINVIEHVIAFVKTWLRSNCKGAFFVERSGGARGAEYVCTVYIANPESLAMFKLFLHEKELEPPPPPPPPEPNPFEDSVLDEILKIKQEEKWRLWEEEKRWRVEEKLRSAREKYIK
jgi:hypothetical protein